MSCELEICKISDLRPPHCTLHLVFCVLSASETGLLLVVILRRNVAMMPAGVKIVHQVMRNDRKSLFMVFLKRALVA